MFYAFFKLVKLDILDSNVLTNVFTHIMDRNVGLSANVSEKNAIMCRAVIDLLKVFTFSYVIISCVKRSFNICLCLEYKFFQLILLNSYFYQATEYFCSKK